MATGHSAGAAAEYNTVPPALIEAGFYYKGNNPGWLRRTISVITMAGFAISTSDA